VSALCLQQLVKHYRTSSGEVIKAVDGIDLKIEPGEMVALYGPSGSGKSTLLMITCGLMLPDSGTVHYGEQCISALPESARASFRSRHLGIVLQSFHLMEGTGALDNAALKLIADGKSLRQARAIAAPWIERVGLGARATEPVERLSMGERQRVAIARALAGDPMLLAADEPTGNLDSRRSAEIVSLLREICRERALAVLLVTHDPQAARFADRTLTLTDGKLHEGLFTALDATFSEQ
jgi:putative ABC transport system ATP-binding protein